MLDNFCETPEEVIRIYVELLRMFGNAYVPECWWFYVISFPKESKKLPDCIFWNTTGDEDRADFPTIYWRKELQPPKEILTELIEDILDVREEEAGKRQSYW